MRGTIRLSLCAVALCYGRASAVTQLQTVWQVGQTAPGMPGATLNGGGIYQRAMIDDSGQVLLNLKLSGSGITTANESSVWTWDNGTMTKIVQTGDPKPGGGTFAGLNGSVIYYNDAGQLAFPSGTQLWRADPISGSPHSFQKIAASSDPAVGTTVQYSFVRFEGIGENGQTYFNGILSGGGITSANDEAGWSSTGSTVSLLWREGTPSPIAGASYGSGNVAGVNASGQAVLSATLTGAGVDSTNDAAILTGGVGTLQKIVRTGEVAPGTAQAFQSLPAPQISPALPRMSLNSAGQVAFDATLVGGGSGIWKGSAGGTVTMIARDGMAAPGTSTTFADFNVGTGFPLLNDQGHVLFPALVPKDGGPSLTGGLWFENNGSIIDIACDGQAAPGTTATFRFSNGSTPLPIDAVFNSSDQIVFQGFLAGAGVTGANSLGIWGGTPGNIQLIARTGDSVLVDGTLKTVTNLAIIQGSANDVGGRLTCLSSSGTLVLFASFSDGTAGNYVAQVVPEPGAMLMIIAGTGLMMRRRRS